MNQQRNDDRNEDVPPYSRIFIVCSKDIKEEDLRQAFEKYGEITNLYIPKNRDTGEPRGVAYIKYTKTSSAAAAIQELHSKTIAASKKPVKVMIATSKNDKNDVSTEKIDRLFIKVSKQATEDEISQHFSKFGDLQSVYILKDKTTNESKGLAFVQFKNFLQAAKAFENCDKTYKAVFASPKQHELKRSRDDRHNYGDNYDIWANSVPRRDNYSDYSNEVSRPNSINSLIKTAPQNYRSVIVTCTPIVSQIYLERLCNLVPGMTNFQFNIDNYNGISRALVTYDNESAAAYAFERLHNFEFPSGELITVKPDNPLSKAANDLTSIVNSFKNAVDSGSPDLVQLADAIAKASTLIKAATTTGRMDSNTDCMSGKQEFCNVALPNIKPLAPPNSQVVERCFIVCKPIPPPPHILKDVFSRFGDLIDVSTLPNRTFGFAKYASSKAAKDAIATLHGAVVYGAKLKVMVAEEKPSKDSDVEMEDHDGDAKRMRFNDRDLY